MEEGDSPLDVTLSLGSRDLGLACMSARSPPEPREGLTFGVLLFAVGGERRRLRGTADGLVAGLDDGTDQLLGLADHRVDLRSAEFERSQLDQLEAGRKNDVKACENGDRAAQAHRCWMKLSGGGGEG